jgi:hypothetical protein
MAESLLALPVSRFAAVFFQQLDGLNDHAPVHGLAHVVDSQQSDLRGGKRFHFYAGLAVGFDRGLAAYAVFIGFRGQIDVYMRDGQRMAERNQIGRFLTGHDAGNSGDSQHIAFFMSAFDDQLERFRLHFNIAFGDGRALSDRFVADIDHVGFAGLIKMG